MDNANSSADDENTNGVGMAQADLVHVEANMQGQFADNMNTDGGSMVDERGINHYAASEGAVSMEENNVNVLKTYNVTGAAESTLNEEDMNIDFENDESLFKTPVIKRKRSNRLRKANNEITATGQ